MVEMDRDSVLLKKRIVWMQGQREYLTLIARVYYEHGAVTPTGLADFDLDPVQQWCKENRCGIRISFDEFRFNTKKEMSFFLLKWG